MKHSIAIKPDRDQSALETLPPLPPFPARFNAPVIIPSLVRRVDRIAPIPYILATIQLLGYPTLNDLTGVTDVFANNWCKVPRQVWVLGRRVLSRPVAEGEYRHRCCLERDADLCTLANF